MCIIDSSYLFTNNTIILALIQFCFPTNKYEITKITYNSSINISPSPCLNNKILWHGGQLKGWKTNQRMYAFHHAWIQENMAFHHAWIQENHGMQDISKDACLSPCLNSKENMACSKIKGCMSFDKGLKENCHLICTKKTILLKQMLQSSYRLILNEQN